MTEFKAPYIEYDDIRQLADSFLKRCHQSRTVPVPIDEIVECDFGVNIIPVLGLQGSFGVEGFISADLKSIYVDEYVYDYIEVRYRFTIAHEIGHVILHKDIYHSVKHTSIGDWKAFIESVPEREYNFLEYHANCFGGLVLVPSDVLARETNKAVDRIRKQGISMLGNWDMAWELISKHLSKVFNVSTDVIEKRLTKDSLREKYK